MSVNVETREVVWMWMYRCVAGVVEYSLEVVVGSLDPLFV